MIDSRTAPYGAFLLRVALGLLFLAHLSQKLFVFTIPGTVGYFQSLGYPGFFAYLVMLGEFGAGIGLLFGIYARLAAVAALPILIGASLQHVGNGWMFASPKGGWEFPVLWIALLVVQALVGPGAFHVKLPNLFSRKPIPQTA